ncbi:related to 2-hydroxychromene-2-carboxylate isomerase [Ramularia collo-cygni]|uniref:Glutathione S-transferase kappa n=1 Tax=Ramularia collo-cygni TaxID=112498 RepID=A0A2D3V025_9PEZI|nr:related to 2-hydroxychromene-2-carboxylate isomerase [Ramularia collo-cygni]CZT18027.1 related to 2-hydroxychromene-2-carboxylate isomerase [Ramularia collo-cygni]
MPNKITLFVDIVSPFGYQAYWLTRNSPAFTKSNIAITYVPILLGGLMNATGNRPPLEIKNKDKWIDSQRKRWAKTFKIPMTENTPTPFPQPTVATQRTLCHIQEAHPEKLAASLDALFKAFWVDGKGPIAKPDVIAEALEPVFGKEGLQEIMKGATSDAAKAKLKGNTEEAFKAGGFGLPWFVAENEKGEKDTFWGVDNIGHLLEFLGVDVKSENGRYKAML